MKHLLFITLFASLVLLCSKNGGDIAGNADVVNSGSIFGMLLSEEGDTIDDTVTVSLYSVDDSGNGLSKTLAEDDEPLETLTSADGSYEFDSLAEGEYSVVVTKDEIIVGGKDGITLETNERKEVDITVVIIINQTFNIWNTDNSQEITINNFYLDNGSVEKTDSGYVLTTAETDTLVFEIGIEKDGETSTITVRIIRDDDGGSTFEIIDTEDDDVEVTITPGTGPATGYLGDITIDIRESGTTGIESTFDTSGVPQKSR